MSSQFQRLVAGFASSIVFSNVGDMIFSTGTSGTANTQIPFIDVMAIKNSGKVGIGTNLPNVKLQIHSTEMIDGGINSPAGGPMAPLSTYAYSALQITNTATTDAVDKGLYFSQKDLTSWIQAKSGSLSISANGVFQSTSNGFTIDALSGAGNIDGASFRLNAQLGNIVFHNPVGGDVLMVNSNGNVGIGNTTPQNKLDITGNATISGNIGIGTVTPTAKIHLVGGNMLIENTHLWTTASWNDIIASPLPSAWRSTNTAACGKYLGYGQTTTGWYWMTADGLDGTATVKYPMSLALDACGKATLRIEKTGWCDFVFEDDYKLISFEERSEFLKTHKHLPDIMTTKQIEENGLDITNTMAGITKNVEEHELYLQQLLSLIHI